MRLFPLPEAPLRHFHPASAGLKRRITLYLFVEPLDRHAVKGG